jgi:hypothetical protein
VVLGRDDVDAEVTGGVGLGELLDVGGARCRDHRLALEVVDRIEVAGLLRDKTAGGQKMGVGEGNLLLAVGIVGGRAAFEIDGPVGEQRNAGR